MCWLHSTCEPSGQVPFAYDDDVYKASWDLFNLGEEYRWFVAAYTLANRGWIELDPQGTTIQPSENLFTDIEYNAYNRLIEPYQSQKVSSAVNLDNLPIDSIKHALRIQGDRFKCKLNPRMVSDTITARKPIVNGMFFIT